tara:strand:- start:616 stop:1794 length:1179 start_codon:yes stop_codon:yes gene_type:complete
MDSIFDPFDQISLLKEKCNNISSHLYKINSFYLEEIRNILPQVIRTSLFSLITNKLGNDFGFSTITSRKIFQLKIDGLVSENISLLTIEHLNELAKKIEEDNIRDLNNAKDEMANAINMRNHSGKIDKYNGSNSINISFNPPLDDLSIIEGWNGEIKAPYSVEYKENDIHRIKPKSENAVRNPERDYETFKDDDKNADTFNLKSNDIEILQSIFSLTDEYNSSDLESKQEELTLKSDIDEDLKNNRLLPQSPIGLYEWMISIDTALVRRLRDLSHSINTELLKSGLVNTLVPINILDAALAGQLISSKSISNILTLKLPTNSSLGSGGLDIDCLLITPSDMEFDNPRLRKNRTHIKHYQNVLLGMIKQQQYWQSRSIAEEVNKEWWKDTTKI